MKYVKLGVPALLVAALLFSLDALLRVKLYSLPASVIVFWEHLFGAILLAPIVLASFKAFRQLTRKQWLAIIGVSFLSGAVGTILYTAALGQINYIPLSVVVLLQQLNPIFAISASALLLGEPLTRRFFGLSAVALVAAYFVSFPDMTVNFSTGEGTLMAAIFAIGAAAAWGISTAFSKYALKDTSTLHITSLRFSITPLFALMFVMLSGNGGKLGEITFTQFKYLIAITFSTGLVALLFYYFGLKRVLASRAAIIELAWPVSAVIVGWIWLNQGLTLSQGIGALILTGAIYLIARDSLNSASTKKKKA